MLKKNQKKQKTLFNPQQQCTCWWRQRADCQRKLMIMRQLPRKKEKRERISAAPTQVLLVVQRPHWQCIFKKNCCNHTNTRFYLPCKQKLWNLQKPTEPKCWGLYLCHQCEDASTWWSNSVKKCFSFSLRVWKILTVNRYGDPCNWSASV